MESWEIPGLTYAVVPAQGVPGIGPACDYFYSEWLPKSAEFEGGEPIMLEYYPLEYSEHEIIYLYFSVKPKKGS